jgi:DNA transformation protein
MPVSNAEQEFVDYIVDLMQSIGPVYAKRMFGGHGIFLEGLMFGLVADSVLYLKADDTIIKEFTELGLDAFTYNKKGKATEISYYQCPEEAMESSEEMNLWANKAYAVALTAAAKKNQ